MHVEILYRPAHAMARVHLAPHESITAESGSMVGMSPNLALQTQSGGLLSGVKRLFGGESFFRNTFTAPDERGELLLAHALCGDMRVLEMTQAGYLLQSSAFVASTPNVLVGTELGGLKSFFSGAGLFVLRATAPSPGLLVVGAFGGLGALLRRESRDRYGAPRRLGRHARLLARQEQLRLALVVPFGRRPGVPFPRPRADLDPIAERRSVRQGNRVAVAAPPALEEPAQRGGGAGMSEASGRRGATTMALRPACLAA